MQRERRDMYDPRKEPHLRRRLMGLGPQETTISNIILRQARHIRLTNTARESFAIGGRVIFVRSSSIRNRAVYVSPPSDTPRHHRNGYLW